MRGIIGLSRRPTRREWRRAFVLFSLGLVALLVVVLVVHPQPPLLATGTPAPKVTLHDSDGASHDVFAEAAGNPVVLEFFTDSCTSCQRQARDLCELHRAFPMVGVAAINAGREPASAVRAYAQRYLTPGCTVRLLVDPHGAVSQSYAITVVPTVYVVDRNGKIAAGGFGEGTVAAASRELRRLSGG